MSLICILDLADLIVTWRHRQKTRRQRHCMERRTFYLPITATYGVPVSACCHISNQLRLTNSCFPWILWINFPQSYATQTFSKTTITNRDLTENNGISAKIWLRDYYKAMFNGILLHYCEQIKTAFVKLTLNISLYQDVGNEYINIKPKRWIRFFLGSLRANSDPFRFDNRNSIFEEGDE